MQVIATETGYYDGALRYAGQEFTLKLGDKPAGWMVEKGKPLPVPPKPFVKTAKEMAARIDPVRAQGTLSGAARRAALAKEQLLAGKTEAAPD